MPKPLLVVEHLSRSFGEVQAVRGRQPYSCAGQIYGLVGPDGAGKTTTLRLICGRLNQTLVLSASVVFRLITNPNRLAR
jgi:ABC-type multidrug transport system ATPase subunit